MVQQITMSQVQQATPKTQSVQTQKDDRSFQSVLKQSTDKLESKKQEGPSKSSLPEKESKKDDTSSVSPEATVLSGLCGSAVQLQPSAQTQPSTASADETVSNPPILSVEAGGEILPTAPMTPDSASSSSGGQTVSADLPIPQNQAAEQTNRIGETSTMSQANVPTGNQNHGTADSTVTQVVHEASVSNTTDFTTQKQENQLPQTNSSQQMEAPVSNDPITVPVSAKGEPTGRNTGAQAEQSEAADLSGQQKMEESAANVQPASSFQNMMQTGNIIIKVSDEVPKTTKPVVHQVADQVLKQYQAGTQNFQMDLYPKELGKVTVKLAVQNGTMTVEISALNPKTQSMLLSNSGEIRALLESAVHHTVEVTQPAQDSQWYQQDQNSSGQQDQQQENQQRQYRYHDDQDGVNDSQEDFLTMIQQLRIKANMS